MTSFEWGAEKLVHEERLTRLFDYLLCYEDAFATIIDDSNSNFVKFTWFSEIFRHKIFQCNLLSSQRSKFFLMQHGFLSFLKVAKFYIFKDQKLTKKLLLSISTFHNLHND